MSHMTIFNGSNPPYLDGPQPSINPQLPLSQLESLRFKANQIIESVNALAFTITGGMNPAYMPSWPEILSKYNLILSQTHNFSNALVNPFPSSSSSSSSMLNRSSTGGNNPENIYQKIVVHPSMGMLDSQMDTEVGPLLRNQQTVDVLKQENETVRRLSEHMSTRGMLGVLGIAASSSSEAAPVRPPLLNGFRGLNLPPPRKPEYEDVLSEGAEIREAHDRRVERAVRAVAMLREKFDWKQRVEVTVEEPEELDWDPRLGARSPQGAGDGQDTNRRAEEDVGMDSDEDEDEEIAGNGSSDEDEENIEGELVPGGDAQTPGSTEGFGPLDPSTENTEAMEGIS